MGESGTGALNLSEILCVRFLFILFILSKHLSLRGTGGLQ
jgi:hypothetical protein